MQILTTDFGPHPHDKWALCTARELVPLAGVKDAARQIAAQRLQADMAEALEPHHQGVQTSERDGLKANGDAHFDNEYDPTAHAAAALDAVLAVSKGTLWEDHFAAPGVPQVVLSVLARHFHTSSSIERMWHADRNQGSAVAQAFKARHHGHETATHDEDGELLTPATTAAERAA